MKAMILAAGMGTRLYPLTAYTPKALVEINGQPALYYVINTLIQAGCTDIVINVHHFAEKIIAYLKKMNNFGINIHISDESDMLLDTGGGLKKASCFFDDEQPFFLHNADILSSISLQSMYAYHIQQQSLVTLAVRSSFSSRALLFDNTNKLCGWTNTTTAVTRIVREIEGRPHMMGFCGIHVIHPKIFSLMIEDGVFSIMDVYMRLALTHSLIGYNTDNAWWADIGSVEKLIAAETYIKNNCMFE